MKGGQISTSSNSDTINLSNSDYLSQSLYSDISETNNVSMSNIISNTSTENTSAITSNKSSENTSTINEITSSNTSTLNTTEKTIDNISDLSYLSTNSNKIKKKFMIYNKK